MKTLNETIEELRKFKPDSRVYFDFCQCIPKDVDSWRGIYAHPALGWEPSGYSGSVKVYPTIAMLISKLELAKTQTFSGWKGGEFSYTGTETLHIDNFGDCTHTEIKEIKAERIGDDFEQVFIITENSEL